MSRAPAVRRVVVSFAACFTLVALFAGLGIVERSTPAGAAGPNHAAMIIETPTDVYRVVISFDADSIDGLQALQLVPGANPSALGFSGLGGAVCGLFGVGHPATSSTCLGEPSDPRYWAYWHVPAGQSGFSDSTYSRAGAGSVTVRNGDTQGWRYGTGEPPTFVQLEFPAPVTPATAPPAAPEPEPSVIGPGGSAGGEMGLPSRGSTTTTVAPTPEQAAADAAAAAAAAGGSSTTSSTREGATTEVAAERASANRDADGGGGSPLLSILGFAAVMVVLAAGIFFARRARVGNRPSAP